MARWYPLYERNPDRASDRATKAKIIEAKLVHELGGQASQAQLILIRSIVSLHLELEGFRERQIKNGYLDKRFSSVQAMLTNTMGQLLNTVNPTTLKAKAKARAEAKESATGTPALDLGAVLRGRED